MVRGLILGALAFGGAFLAERQFESVRKDIERYDRLRTMSGEKPFLRELLDSALGSVSEFGAARGNDAKDLVGSLTSDLVRYAHIRSM